MRRLLAASIVLCSTVLLLLLAQAAGVLERLELLTLDARIALGLGRKPPGKDVLIAWIDQESIDTLREADSSYFPWPRSVYRDGIDYIASGKPKAIVLDILWTEPRETTDDREFGKALTKVPGDVHSFKFVGFRPGGLDAKEDARFAARALPDGIVDPALRASLATASGFVLPIPEIEAGADALGFVNIRADADKVYRRYDLVRLRDGKAYPSLAFAAVLQARGTGGVRLGPRGLELDKRLVPTTEDGRLQLAFRGGEFTFPRIKFVNILRSAVQVDAKEKPDVPPETFTDKIVIVGIHAEGYEDITPTPTSPLFMGPELHATAIDDMLAADALRPVPFGWPLAVAIAATALAIVLLAPNVPIASLGAVGTLGGLAYAGGFAFSHGLVLPLALPACAWLLATGGAFVQRLVVEGKRRRELKRAFTSYMAPEVVAEVMANPDRVRLGGETRALTFFFTDLKGFTSLAEALEPQELVAFLNDYFTRMCAHVMAERGIVDKFIGDAIMALFGAPLALPAHGLHAVRAALQDLEEMRAINRELEARGKPPVQMRIGIHAGTAVVGNMGSASRFDYTAIGDSVNLASRLEGANKAFGTSCLVSETAWSHVADTVLGREVGKVVVVGRTQPISVYEPIAVMERATALDRDFVGRYNAALQALRSGDRAGAKRHFASARELRPGDALIGAYLERIEDERFDGTFALDSK